jgi:tRNA threonylcarbamoyl adenosine modification protein YeaZ
MNLISIVTNENPSSICITSKNLKKQTFFQDPKLVAEEMKSIISETLRELEININDIDGVAVITGPGSYTGLRVGLAFAKGLVQFSKRKLFAVNAFDVLRYKFLKADPGIIPIVDARNGRVYMQKNSQVSLVDLATFLEENPDAKLVGTAENYTHKNLKICKLDSSDLDLFINDPSTNLQNYNSNNQDFNSLLPMYVLEPRIG